MRVKLMADYDCWFPIWIDFDEATPSSIEDVELRRRIERWNDLFLTCFDAETGWRDDEVRHSYAEEGRRLHAALEVHFGEAAEVTYDAWPVS